MDRLEFDCMFDLAETMIALLGESDDDYPIVSAYGKYDVIKSLLEDLIMSGVEIANEIELQEYDISHYNKEFILYLTENGVNVEKTYRDGEYLYGGGEISFVHEDCSSKLLPYVDSKTIYEFGMVDDDDDDDCDCTECTCKDADDSESTHISRDKHGNPLGFSKTWSTVRDGVHCYSSYSHYSNNIDMLKEIASQFGVRL